MNEEQNVRKILWRKELKKKKRNDDKTNSKINLKLMIYIEWLLCLTKPCVDVVYNTLEPGIRFCLYREKRWNKNVSVFFNGCCFFFFGDPIRRVFLFQIVENTFLVFVVLIRLHSIQNTERWTHLIIYILFFNNFGSFNACLGLEFLAFHLEIFYFFIPFYTFSSFLFLLFE